MADSSFWNIGTQQQPIIQGQAGKPFYHSQGPLLKFQDPEEEVDNKCLCKYRYMRYYAFYAYVRNQPYADVQVYQDFQLPLPQDQDEIQFRNYNLQDPAPPGYQWRIWDGPVYIGCHPQGSFTCGQWLPVQLPCPSSDSPANTTVPAPSYIYQLQDYQRKSLMCMIVCSYKCCNGKKGCGTQIQRPPGDTFCSDFPLCYAQYYVTGLSNEDTSKHKAQLIKGTQGCICTPPFCIQRKFIQHDCDSVTVRAFKQMSLPVGWQESDCKQVCPQCQQALQDIAKGWAKAQGNWSQCVQWLLWKWQLPSSCDPCQVSLIQPQRVTDFQDIPPQVLGKGAGWMPKKFHTQQRMDYCGTQGGGTSYQWTYITVHLQDATEQQIKAAAPQKIAQNPCKDFCGGQGHDLEQGKVSDSLSNYIGTKDSPQPPCNSPDAPPYVYKEFQHRKFTVWSLKLTKLDDPDNPYIDPCYDSYRLDPQSEDLETHKLIWSSEQTAAYDYQLQLHGWFLGTKFLSFRKDKPNKVFLVLPADQEPPEDPDDQRLVHLKFITEDPQGTVIQDVSKNHCKAYYQVYYNKDCRCPDPCQNPCPEEKQTIPDIFSGVCAKWRFVGRLSQSQLQQIPICLGKWTQSTVQNTFSTEQKGPIGDYVYTIQTQDQNFCGDLPEPPSRVIFYLKVVIKSQCPDTQHQDNWTSFTPSIQSNISECPVKSVEGFKAVDSISNSQLLNVHDNIVQPGDNCQVYYFKKLDQILQDTYTSQCQQQPSQQPEIPDPVFDPMPTVNWNTSKCPGGYYNYTLKWYKASYGGGCGDSAGTSTQITDIGVQHFYFQEPVQITTGWRVTKDYTAQPIDPATATITTCQLYFLAAFAQKRSCQAQDYPVQPQSSPPVIDISWPQSCYAHGEIDCNNYQRQESILGTIRMQTIDDCGGNSIVYTWQYAADGTIYAYLYDDPSYKWVIQNGPVSLNYSCQCGILYVTAAIYGKTTTIPMSNYGQVFIQLPDPSYSIPCQSWQGTGTYSQNFTFNIQVKITVSRSN